MTARFVRVDMDDDGTAEFTGLDYPHDVPLRPLWFGRTHNVDDTAAQIRNLLAHGYVAGPRDDDARVPGRRGLFYQLVGGPDAA